MYSNMIFFVMKASHIHTKEDNNTTINLLTLVRPSPLVPEFYCILAGIPVLRTGQIQNFSTSYDYTWNKKIRKIHYRWVVIKLSTRRARLLVDVLHQTDYDH